MGLDRDRLKMIAGSRLGIQYGLGAKWNSADKDPRTPIDCSGFVRWCWAQMGVKVPDGSWNQRQESRSLGPTEGVCIGDVGFFMRPGGEVHHVGLVFSPEFVIEARGQMIDLHGEDAGERVLLRPRVKWEAFDQFKFAGGWRRFLAVDKADMVNGAV